METTFGAPDICQIAEQLEYDCSKYYLESAESCDNPRLRRVCYDLAFWKAKNARHYARMEQSSHGTSADLERHECSDYLASHPRAMAGLAGLADRQRPGWLVTGGQGHDDGILVGALRRGKDTMAFYRGLRGFAADSKGNMAVDEIVARQQHYINLLLRLTEYLRAHHITMSG